MVMIAKHGSTQFVAENKDPEYRPVAVSASRGKKSRVAGGLGL
jgi:hypothetical protein